VERALHIRIGSTENTTQRLAVSLSSGMKEVRHGVLQRAMARTAASA
jgi:hypothetical protein